MFSGHAYAELHARSAFSFLEGVSHPGALVQQALRLGLPALALCDQNGLYGVVEAREALLEAANLFRREDEGRAPLKLIYGSELGVQTSGGLTDSLTALALDRDGYRSLCRLISKGRLRAPKGEFRLDRDSVGAGSSGGARGLHFLIGGPRSAAMQRLTEGDLAGAKRALAELRELLGDKPGDNLSVELVRHQAPGDLERSITMATLASELGLAVVATNDVAFDLPAEKPFQDLLRCIRLGLTLEEAGRRLAPNAEAHLKAGKQMAQLFRDLPAAIARSAEIAQAVRFRLCDIRYAYPAPDLPPGFGADDVLAELCRAGLRERLGAKADGHLPRLTRELDLIRELQYAGYFLSMRHIVEVCAEKGILCQGRGSAANSLVCYALRITSVPPDTIDMLFERFISRERNEPPDIDLDIEHERREEVIQHVYAKFGRDHAGMVAEVIRYRRRSALREVGKALGYPEAQLNRMSKFLTHEREDLDAAALRAAGIDVTDKLQSEKLSRLLQLAQRLEGLPRHLSIHVGGFVLSHEKLSEIVPLENGRMADRTVIQWDKDGVDAMAMFKLDLLGLGMLTVLAKAFKLIADGVGPRYGLETVPPDDPAVYAMIGRADTIGVFQIESRAQMNMLPRLAPKTFYDLVIEVAIVRPGPIQGKMVHPYLRRRIGAEPVEYPHPALEPILHRTLGVPLFQEQVMRLAEAVGGYTPGEADQLRRDMASWKSSGRMDRHKRKLLSGMLQKGLTPEYAERIFQQIEGFGSYGFPESHAAAFAHLAYVSAYLKCHHPVEFAAALINSQPMGFYSPAVIANDLKRHGGRVWPVDANRSVWDCALEEAGLRLGFRLVRGLGEETATRLVAARRARPFENLADLVHRAQLGKRERMALAAAGAFAAFGERRRTLWEASATFPAQGDLYTGRPRAEAPADLPPLEEAQTLAWDARFAQSFPGRHPMELVREMLSRRGVLAARDLAKARPGSTVTVAGLVITRQRPESAGGAVFMTLEDETGNADVALSRERFLEFQTTARLASALVVRGTLRAERGAYSVNAAWLRSLETVRAGVESHDFH